LNGAPHAITAGCYSADRSPSPIKTRVKATSRGGQEKRKTEEESQGGTGEKKETLGTRKSHTAGKKKLGKTGGKKLKLNPDEKPETGEKNRGKTEHKSRERNNTQRDRENKRAAINRDEYWLCHCLRPCKQRKPRIKTNSQQASLFITFSASKVAEKTKGTRRQVSAEGRQREAAGEDPSAL
jgi:hypothetical protein